MVLLGYGRGARWGAEWFLWTLNREQWRVGFLAPTSQYNGEVILTCFPPESMRDLDVWHGRCDSHEEFVPRSPTKWPLSGLRHLPLLVGAFMASPISWLRKGSAWTYLNWALTWTGGCILSTNITVCLALTCLESLDLLVWALYLPNLCFYMCLIVWLYLSY